MSLNPFSLLRPIAIADNGPFLRASTGTYYDKFGSRQSAAGNIPRFTYDPTTLVPQGLLLEQATTNRLLFTSDFTQAIWTKSATTITGATTVGAASMSSLIATAATAVHALSQAVTVSSTLTLRSFALDLKPAPSGNCTHAQIIVDDGAGTNGGYINIRLADGVITRTATNFGTVTDAFANVQFLISGSFRVSLFMSLPGTTARVRVVMLDTANAATATVAPSIAFTTSDFLYLGSTQYEDGQSSFIDSAGTVGTRAVDTYLGVLAVSNVPETPGTTDPAAWVAATAYTAGQQVSRIVGVIHNIYQRLISGTTATAPESDTTNWVYVGPTNRWKMFDAINETQTTNPDDIQMMVQPSALCDSIAFDNLDADTIRVYVQGTTYDKTIQLKTRPCANWFQYFFEPFKFTTTAVFTGLPLVTTNLIHVIIRKAGLTAKLGTCVPALQRVIGYAEPGAQTGIIDYSSKSTDQFGSTTVTKRAYSKRMTLSVIIDNSDLDAVQDLLAKYRSTPVVWLGAASAFSSLVVYGYYKSFDNVIAYPTQSRCNIEIEGLT